MDTIAIALPAIMKAAVILFQVGGVAGLGISRLGSCPRWAGRGRVALVIALVGLGVAGALCGGQQESEFSLFAGGTITLLLVGMTIGGGGQESPEVGRVLPAEGSLV